MEQSRIAEDWLHPYQKELIKYKDDADDIISSMALRGLANLKQPQAVQALLEVFRSNHTHFCLFPEPSWDLEVLYKAHNPDIDTELWKIFRDHLSDDTNYNGGISQIPRLLSYRTNPDELDEIIALVLSSDTLYSADALKSLLSVVSSRVCKICDSLLPEVEKKTPLWYRIIICQAYCGEEKAIKELLGIAAYLDKCLWTNRTNGYYVYPSTTARTIIRCQWQCLVIHVIRERRLLDAVPILEQVVKNSQEHNVRVEVDRALVFLWPFTGKVRTQQQVERCIEHASTRHPLGYYPCSTITEYFCNCLQLWTPEEIQFLFTKLATKINESISNENMDLSRELYHLLASLRERSSRRFLNIFKNWPNSSYKNKDRPQTTRRKRK